MEAIFTLDNEGYVIEYNQKQDYFGYNDEEIIGQNLSKLIPSFHQNSNSETSEDKRELPTEVKEPEETSAEPNSKRVKTETVEVNKTTWKTPGTFHKDVLHKAGNIFPAKLDVSSIENTIKSIDPDGKETVNSSTKYLIKLYKISPDGPVISPRIIGKYFLIKTVGQGSYGKVKLAIHKETKLNVAIKTLQMSRMNHPELERTRRETEILRKLAHPHICHLFETIESDEYLHLVMEFAGRTLLSYVLEKSGLGEIEGRKFFMQILSAIKYCHDRNIIHRDIKHQNILLDEKMNCKIIDFGLSNFMETGKLRNTFCGTPAYAAPEMILGKGYSGPEVDIWSMGVVLYSMITGVFPFDNVGDIVKGTFKDPTNCSPECCELLRKMLQVDLQTRATISQVIEHSWVKEEYEKLAESKAVHLYESPRKFEQPKDIECKVVGVKSI